MSARPPAVLLAVEPPVLASALAEVLGGLGAVIVDLRDQRAADRYDAAVVSITLPHYVDARVVIRLPDAHGNGGDAVLIDGLRAGVAPVVGVDDLLRLLRDHDVI